MLNLSKDQINAIHDMCLDDSTKIILYLEKEKRKQKPFNICLLIVTVISVIASVIAAITSIITLL